MSSSGYKGLTRMLLRSEGLLDQAEAALQRVVAADPGDAAALLRLGDVQRGVGKLGEALESYRRLTALRPDDPRAAWLVAILSGGEANRRGEELPAAPPLATRPTPFVRVPEFLPPQQCGSLLAVALASRERCEPAAITRARRAAGSDTFTVENVVDPLQRNSLVVDHRITQRKVRPRLEARLRGAFARALPRLQMSELGKSRIELTTNAYLGGGLFAKHRDNNVQASRVVSFVYFFHRRPRRFSGGELLLHDGAGNGAFTRIEPQHNSIVFFPAACWHQVAPIEGVVDFEDARFTVQGWLHEGDCPAAK